MTSTAQQSTSTVAKPQTAPTSVTVTARAALRVAKILASEAYGKSLRISVDGGGCSGFSYKYDLVDDVEKDDLVLRRDGATILIDPISLPYLEGSEIDFVDDLMGQSFQITNPNATASCGCGTSFSI
ncbi:MAG: iron-sulfur cluster insertion protein ErpA [Hyphomicrobiales bacterium]